VFAATATGSAIADAPSIRNLTVTCASDEVLLASTMKVSKKPCDPSANSQRRFGVSAVPPLPP
jgi:hypothetical protein